MADTLSHLEEGFHRGLEELLEEMPVLPLRLEDAVASEEAFRYGREAARQSLAPIIWRVLAGNVLTTEAARTVLGVSRQALQKRVAKGTLLGLPGERTTLFPAWQFTDTGEVREAVPAVLRIFREQLGERPDPRIILAWATTAQPELKDETPAEWISADRGLPAVLSAAERAAEALSR